MHDKLKLLLQKVNLPNEYYDVFNNGKILKLKLDSSRKNGVFVVEVENIIPSNIIDYINKNVTKAFADMNTIKVEFISKNINYNDAINFYSNAIEKSIKICYIIMRQRTLVPRQKDRKHTNFKK